MRSITLFAIAALFIAGCHSTTTLNPMKGKWKLVDIAPTDTTTTDSTGNLGIALLALSAAINDVDTFVFSDSTYTMKGTKGTYHINNNTAYMKNDGNTDTFTYSISNDTLALRSTEKYVLRFKQIK